VALQSWVAQREKGGKFAGGTCLEVGKLFRKNFVQECAECFGRVRHFAMVFRREEVFGRNSQNTRAAFGSFWGKRKTFCLSGLSVECFWRRYGQIRGGMSHCRNALRRNAGRLGGADGFKLFLEGGNFGVSKKNRLTLRFGVGFGRARRSGFQGGG